MKAQFIQIGEDTTFLAVGSYWFNLLDLSHIHISQHGVEVHTSSGETTLEEDESQAVIELLEQQKNKEPWRGD
jgi:hypothetical protein